MSAKAVLGIIMVAVLVAVPVAAGILGDYLWFSSIGLESVFLSIFFTRFWMGLAAFAAFAIFSIANLRFAARGSKRSMKPFYLLALLFSLALGLGFSGSWDTMIRYANSVPFGLQDPLFSMDIGFFAFEFPFLGLLISYLIAGLLLTLFLFLASCVAAHAGVRKAGDDLEGFERPSVDWKAVKKRSTPQLSLLLGLLFFAISFGLLLAQWSLVLSPTGAVFGAGYTDVNFTLPLLSILLFISVAVGLLFLANISFKRWRLTVEGIGAFVLVLVVGLAVTGVVQAFIVEPNEFNLEKPYIERNIEQTLRAYTIDSVEESLFPVSYNLTQEDISANHGTLNNVRLWDWRPLMTTYNQLQLFRTYYSFNDVDIDRYHLDGEYRQVMVSAREMDVSSLPSQAQTWVNTRLVYTHGYGFVMNPVDSVTPEGLPEFLVKDIPPAPQVQDPSLRVERNGIYFGEGDLDYAIVKTTTEEFDYPVGEGNVYTSYEGEAGVEIGSLPNRIIYALEFRSPQILFSSSIQPESRILLHRNILDRVRTVAPFLEYDSDPYIVLDSGKLYWIIDAYTTLNTYPYSQPFEMGFLRDINYVRNPVKVVVDAYSGELSFYVIDPEDPLIQSYQKAFPSLFLPIEEMPTSLRKHVRYPEGLFMIQASIYSVYHMEDPMVFYNREDVWVSPEEIYRGSRQELAPYYVIMKLPGKEKEEFVLILPFVPRGKDNMIGWMAARSDQPDYGKLMVFRFSKQELIYGPLQIEARIDQDTDISALFTLWSQAGSSVIRGNTLIIPVEDSILYIEPVFLEATEKGTLPQLRRVIVAYGDRLTMQPTLEDALEVIFGKSPGQGPISLPDDTPEETIERIRQLFQDAQDALTDGDFTAYASAIEQIGELLGAS